MSGTDPYLNQAPSAGTTEPHRQRRPSIAPLTMTTNRDSYLDSISNDSLQVLARFGPEAPARLMAYIGQLEIELKQQQRQAQELGKQMEYIENLEGHLQAAQSELEALRKILTDPEQLIDYVSRFFGSEGPYPGGALITRGHSPAMHHGRAGSNAPG